MNNKYNYGCRIKISEERIREIGHFRGSIKSAKLNSNQSKIIFFYSPEVDSLHETNKHSTKNEIMEAIVDISSLLNPFCLPKNISSIKFDDDRCVLIITAEHNVKTELYQKRLPHGNFPYIFSNKLDPYLCQPRIIRPLGEKNIIILE